MRWGARSDAVDSTEILKRYQHVVELLEDLNVGFIIRDREGIITAISRDLLQWLGYMRFEVEGQPLINLIPDDLREINLEAMQETEQGDTRARLTTMQRKDGSTLPMIVLSTRIFDDNGEYSGICTIVIELGTVQTAKNLGRPSDLQSTLNRIAIELRSLSATVASTATRVNLNHPQLDDLSLREREVLEHLMDGKRVPSIATGLHISPHTVRNHLKSTFRKLGVKSQAELIDHVRSL